MQRHTPSLYRCTAALLIATALTPVTISAAPRPLDPGTAHVKILRRGVGNWIAIQEINGMQLFGRILETRDHSVILQLHNDPETTEVFYTDVAYLRTGFTPGQKILMIAGIGAFAGSAIYGLVHIHNLDNKPLTPPMPAAKW